MPFQIGKAGAGTREIARKRALRICLALLALIVISSVLTLTGNKLLHLNTWVTSLLGYLTIGMGIGFLISVIKVSTGKDGKDIETAITRAVKGAKAEEKISEILDGLPKKFAVFNDFPCPMGNIDHIVVGPTGVFVIETKSHTGEITISPEGKLLRDGKPLEKDFLKQVLGQCFWLKEKMSGRGIKVPYINAVVVFTRAFVKVYQPVKGVRVVNKKWLLNYLTEPKNNLNEDERHQVFWHLLAIKSTESGAFHNGQ
ncbi:MULTISPECIES: nuclease-related domain-containing protein [unclassified Neomoorella]|uniref:nuclease-related domain-containing protein n=1 Tax=unclassified Neomoorella TaxID=2676739 RepID=UPI001C0E9C34|nr:MULTISPECIES: nuclease-related domain-containing protein [unclassified Moorella (in: firmicutes)]